MLGLNSHTRNWRWKASGKHPAAVDYIDLSNGTPLMDALADWMIKGYVQLQRRHAPMQADDSWRFWLRGPGRGMLVCGVIRDSADRIGRPFPLLIVGEGPLKNWERQWETMPVRLSRTWARIERLAARRHADLHAFAHGIDQLGAPDNGRDPAVPTIPVPGTEPRQDLLNAFRNELERNGRIVIDLDGQSVGSDTADSALRWHSHLKTCCTDIPRAVFVGGTSRRSALAVIRHPLAIDDFITLWSL